MAPAKETSGQDPAKDAGKGDGESVGVDTVLDQLEGVVAELESGELPLERALDRFAAGVRLARRGGQMLDAVEERVETLLAERDDVAPLPSSSDDD